MPAQPTPAQERWLLLASRLTEPSVAAWIEARTGGWRSVGLFTRIAFFCLGVLAAAMTFGIVQILRLPAAALIAGIVLVVVAEWLIAAHRLSNAGIEAALALSGWLLTSFWLLEQFDNRDVGTALALTIAFAVAGWRLRNPLFTLLAAMAGSVTLALVFDRPSFLYSAANNHWASLYCYGVASAALGLSAMQLQRPAHDHMLDWLVVVMPPVGYVWSAHAGLFGSGVNYFQQPSLAQLYVIVAPLSFAVCALLLGLRRRTHAPLLACMVCVVCLAYELRGLTDLSVELRLILWGGVTLLGAVLLERCLRTPRRGLTARPLSARADPLDLLQLAGTALVTPAQPAPSQPGFDGAGGKFGGGGSSGQF